MDGVSSELVPRAAQRRSYGSDLGYSTIVQSLPRTMKTDFLPGLVTAGVCNLCLAASLAEFLSAYPTFVIFFI